MDVLMKSKQLFIKYIAPLFLLMLLSISADAEVGSYINSLTLQSQSLYRANSFTQYFDNYNNYVKRNKPLELYVDYQCQDIKKWNDDYPQYAIDEIKLTAIESHRVLEQGELVNLTQGNTTAILSAMNTPFNSRKLFFRLFDRDTLLVDLDTFFSGKAVSDSPCSFQIIYPTWDCDSCNEYKEAVMDSDITESNRITANKNLVLGYIGRFFQINLEILLIAFWIIIISVFLLIVSFIIYLIFIAYHFIRQRSL